MSGKTQQLQIRVTLRQKAALRRLAREAGHDLSSYVLARVLPEPRLRFGEIVRALREGGDHRYALADLNDMLSGSTRAQLNDAVAVAPPELRDLPPFLQNYVAAMVEQASHQRDVLPPTWVRDVPPLDEPYFATPLRSLRLHLLREAPVPFKRRNLFVDSAVGARV
ncbi:MAG: plasmid mobilization protein [Longimicrobiales bacterium]